MRCCWVDTLLPPTTVTCPLGDVPKIGGGMESKSLGLRGHNPRIYESSQPGVGGP